MPSAPETDARSRRAGLLALAVAVLGWGLNWPAIKLLVAEWPPLFLRGTAGCLGALLLAAYAAGRGESFRVPRAAVSRLLWGAFTNVFAWMGFPTVAMLWLDVAEGALLVYTMPIWAMLFAWPVLGARPTARSLLALALSFVGVALILTTQGLALGPGKLPGIVLVLAAAIIFALGTVMQREPLPLSPVVATAWQVSLGCIPMLVLSGLFEGPVGPLSSAGWAMWVYMAVGPMALAYLGWFAALGRLPPATAASATLLIPVMGTLSAAVVLGETLGLRQVLAMALTLGGVALALRPAASGRAPLDRPGPGR